MNIYNYSSRSSTHLYNIQRFFCFARQLLSYIEIKAFVIVLFAAIVIVPYSNIHWSNSGWVGVLLLITGGLLLAFAMMRSNWEFVKHGLNILQNRYLFGTLLVCGVIAHFAIATITNPILFSDARTYLDLARSLADGNQYSDELGYLAFWPPGFPIYLTPFVFIFGAGWLAVTVSNLVLYFIGVLSARSLGTKIFDERVGTVAALLFTVWPSRLLTAGVPQKENLTLAMILTGISFCISAFRASGKKGWFYAVGAGGAFGVAALAQPGLLLFAFATPIIFRSALSAGMKTYIARCMVVIVSAIIVVAPWNIRNFIVFEGEFSGVSTNGGSVFYRANNPIATGGWIAEGEVPISHLPELEQYRLGFDLGKQWIYENPADFVKLSVKKVMYLLRDDAQGAYVAILRGGGGLDDEDSRRNSTATRMWIYRMTAGFSLVFWLLISAWSVKSIQENKMMQSSENREHLLPLVYPLLYSVAIFSIFESGTRQRATAQGVLLVLAASFLVASKVKHRTAR